MSITFRAKILFCSWLVLALWGSVQRIQFILRKVKKTRVKLMKYENTFWSFTMVVFVQFLSLFSIFCIYTIQLSENNIVQLSDVIKRLKLHS